MKKCPLCQNVFDDTNDFCLNDGTPLVMIGGGATDTPTQILSAPITRSDATTPRSGSPMLYLIVGVLATALVAALAFIFLFQSRPDEAKKPESSATAKETGQANTPTNVVTSTSSAPTPPPANSNLRADGNWSGQLSYGTGSAFSAQSSLTDSGTGQISGQITWVLLRTSNPQKMYRVGETATEYVQGTFNPGTRQLQLVGTRVTSDLIIKDKYRLTMSPDGRSLSGVSYGGKTRGQLTLRK